MDNGAFVINNEPPKDSIHFQEVSDITKFIPLGNRVVGRITKDPDQEIVVKGIIMPGDKQNPYVEAEVLAVGRGTTIATGVVPCEVKVGDMCLLWNGKAFPLVDGNKKYVIFQETDIVALFKKPETK
jgi:co-chaperonin GroES (HSP10)